MSARVTDIYIAAVVSGITLNGSLNQNKYYFDQGKNINIYTGVYTLYIDTLNMRSPSAFQCLVSDLVNVLDQR